MHDRETLPRRKPEDSPSSRKDIKNIPNIQEKKSPGRLIQVDTYRWREHTSRGSQV